MSSTSGHGRHRRLVLRSGGLFEGPRVLDVEGLFRNLRDLCLRSSGNTFPWCINIPHPGGQPTDIVASSHGSRIKWHIRRTTRDRYWGLCHNLIISSRNFVAGRKVMDIKVPPAAESNRFREEKFSPA